MEFPCFVGQTVWKQSEMPPNHGIPAANAAVAIARAVVVDVVPAPAPTTVVAKAPARKPNLTKKRNGAWKSEDGEHVEVKKISWNKDLVEELIELRYSEERKASYGQCRSVTEKSAWWKGL